MAINFESQVYAECDRCRASEARQTSVADMKRILRLEGWSIGKRVLCPECRLREAKEKKEGKHQ